jgi:drug/metabolite transporter (DMT)-like permease
MNISDNLRGALYMNLSMFAFTVNDTIMKSLTQSLPLYQTIALRGVVAVLGLLILARARGGLHLPKLPADRAVIALRSVVDVAATILFLTALKHMPLATLSAVMQVTPLAVTLGAALYYKDKIGWRRMLAIFIGFLGVMLIIRPGMDGFSMWSLLGLASVATVVVRDLSVRRLSGSVPSLVVALGAASCVLVMGMVGSTIEGWQTITPFQILQILGAGGMVIVGYICSVTAMRVGDIGFIAPFRYTSLLWAIILGWVFFATFPDGYALIGAAIVVATGIYTLLRERKLRQRARAAA